MAERASGLLVWWSVPGASLVAWARSFFTLFESGARDALPLAPSSGYLNRCVALGRGAGSCAPSPHSPSGERTPHEAPPRGPPAKAPHEGPPRGPPTMTTTSPPHALFD